MLWFDVILEKKFAAIFEVIEVKKNSNPEADRLDQGPKDVWFCITRHNIVF